MSPAWHAEWAWTGRRFERDVLLEADGDTFTRVEAGVVAPPGARRLAGCTLPGLVNAHSHAFHRALRGAAQPGAGDFWGWRRRMYAAATALDPDGYHRLARACFAEMALAGITTVGEFHYLHHDPEGRPYDQPDAMAEAVRTAATAAGIRLTLLDTLYLHGEVGGGPLDPVQRRFSDGSAERWAARVRDRSSVAAGRAIRQGVAIHSVRAVGPDDMRAAVDLAEERDWPLHVHVSEQRAENDACLAAFGCTPTELLDRVGALGERTTVVHATHASHGDLDLLAATGTAVCLCPTTERDLADGVGPARAMAARRIRLAFGSDSHAVIDHFEEARAAELDERLVTGTRQGLAPEQLLAALTEGGSRSLGWPEAGRLAEGHLADLVTVGLGSVRLAGTAGTAEADLPTALVYAATAADVTDVVVAGRPVVAAGRHLLVDDVAGELAVAVGALREGAGDEGPRPRGRRGRRDER